MCLWNVNVGWIPLHALSRNNTSLCCPMWSGALSLGCSPARSPGIPQDLQLCVELSRTPENSRCTVCAPQKKWWHSAQITAADGARNLKLGPRGDRSLFPVFTLSLTVSLPVFIWHMTGREERRVGTSRWIRPFWASVRSGFGFQRPIRRTQPNWADLSYPLLTECTLVLLLQRRDFGKWSSRCFLTLLPMWICRRESRLIDCRRLNDTLVHYKLKDQPLYNWICIICMKKTWVRQPEEACFIQPEANLFIFPQLSWRIQFWKFSWETIYKVEYLTNEGVPSL